MAADGLVRFVSCDALTFAGLTKDTHTLYFVTDEHRIYKGDVPMSGDVYKVVETFPTEANAVKGAIYFNSATGEVRAMGETAYTQLVKPLGAIANGNEGLVTGDQVFDYVAQAIETVNGTNSALAGRVDAIESEQTTQNSAIQAAQKAADDAQDTADTAVANAATAQAAAEAAQGAADDAQDAADQAQREVDALEGVVATKADDSALQAEITRAKAAEKTNADAAKAAADAAAEAQKDIDAFFDAAEKGEAALDTLKEIQEYLDSEGAAADQMVKDIAANKAAVEAEVARAEQAEGNLAGDIEEVAGDVADLQTQVGTGTVDSRIEAAKTAAATDAKNKADAAQAAAISAAATDATQKADKALSDAKIYATAEALDALAYAKDYADGLAGNYATKAQGAKADTAVQSVVEGTANGTILVDGNTVNVHGLGSAAYTAVADYATAIQGTKADSALQKADIVEGTTNGAISVKGSSVKVHGLGTAAYKADTAFDAAGAAAAAQTAAKGYADDAVAAAKTELKTYADQAEADAKAYADGLAGNCATKAQGTNADTAIACLTWQEL